MRPFVFCLFLVSIFVGCDSSSDYFIEESLEYEYVELDTTKMAALELVEEKSSIKGEPLIEFISEHSLIKRFSTLDDFYIAAELVAEEARLIGTPILIHEALQEYLRFGHTIPLSELSLVNHEGKIIIGDTLYSLHGNSYSKRHIDGNLTHDVELTEFDPVEEIAVYLTTFIQARGVSRVTDALIPRKSASGLKGVQASCGIPDNLDFAPGAYIGKSENTDICVWDFTYPGIRNSGAVGYSPNVPGAVVMWNSSYRSWTGGSRGEAYTVFYKYQTVDGSSELHRVRYGDLPTRQVAISKATVTTFKRRSWWRCSSVRTRSNTSYGELSTRVSIDRCNGTGTRSEHTASLTNVFSLPSAYRIY